MAKALHNSVVADLNRTPDSKTKKKKGKRKQRHPENPTVEGTETRKQVWYDSDDEISDERGLQVRYSNREAKSNAEYRQRLVEAFQLVHGIPSWSLPKKKRKKIEDDDDMDFEEGNVKLYSSSVLKSGQINIVKVQNLNNDGFRQQEFVRNVEFHPRSQVGLVAGSKSTVSLFQVDGSTNAKIQSVDFENFPIGNATFAADGMEIYVSSPSQRHFYTYDMMSGKITKIAPTYTTRYETIRKIVKSPDNQTLVSFGHHGNMYLHSRHSKEMISILKMNGEVQSVAFNSSGSRMYSTGTLGEVYEWDMNNRVCVSKFVDEGTIVGSALAVTPNFLATGSCSGVVNIYDRERLSTPFCKPVKNIMNLTTRVTSLEANHTGELLAFGSYEKRDVVKLVHLPSMSVYSNFPFVNTFWGRPNTMAFSPNSGYFSFGNDRGEAYLFRLEHFENY